MLSLPRYIVSAVVIMLCAVSWCYPAHADSKEYLVKSAFIYNFVKFVEWPGAKDTKTISSMNVCIIGGNPFGSALEKVLKKASSPQLALKVKEIPVWQGRGEDCHIAFLSTNLGGSIPAVASNLASHSVLTISEVDGFARSGGMIEFVEKDKKVKLVVNTKSAGKAGLRVDAQLLEIALDVIR